MSALPTDSDPIKIHESTYEGHKLVLLLFDAGKTLPDSVAYTCIIRNHSTHGSYSFRGLFMKQYIESEGIEKAAQVAAKWGYKQMCAALSKLGEVPQPNSSVPANPNPYGERLKKF